MAPLVFDLHAFDSVESTNVCIKEAIAAGAPEGYAVFAREQTGGYGRHGSAWKSPVGGLYMSLILRPGDHSFFAEGGASVQERAMRLSSVGIIVAIALRRALLEFVSNEEACAIALKWPNDLIVCGGVQEGSIDDATTGSADASSTFRKISGISIEQVSGAICVGIGVNVNQPAGLRGASDSPEAQGLDFGRKAKVDTTHKFEGDKRNAAAYLADLAGNELDCKVIATQILDELALAYSQWVDCGFAPFVAEYKANCAFKGQSVKVELDDGSAVEQGKVEGIDNYGRLIVNGTPITSGSIHAL